MGAILSMAAKDLRILARDRLGLFFTLVFPLVYAIFFGSIFSGMGGDDEGGMSEIDVLVVDEDDSEESRAFFAALDATGSMRIIASGSRSEAEEAVRTGSKPAFLVAPPGFGADLASMFSGTPAKLELGVDPSRRAERMMLEGMILQEAFARMGQRFTDPEAMRASIAQSRATIESSDIPPATRTQLGALFDSVVNLSDALGSQAGPDGATDPEVVDGVMQAMTPVQIVDAPVQRAQRAGPQNAFEISFPQAISWAVIGAAAGFGISFVTERQKGTLVRLSVAPLSAAAVLFGKALACFITVVVVTTLLLAVGIAAFEVRPDSYALLAASVLCIGVCFVGLMMLLATLAKTEAAAGGIGWAVMMVFAMLGGGMVPVFFMPRWMQSVGSVSPVKWAIVSLEGALWRGFDLRQMAAPLGALVVVGVVGFVAATAMFSRSASR